MLVGEKGDKMIILIMWLGKLSKIAENFPQKNGSKRAKIGVFWPKIAVFSGFFH